jgi:hypothetical protein
MRMLHYRWFAKIYGWTPEQVDGLPPEAIDWLPAIENAMDEATAMEQRAEEARNRGRGRGR